MNVLVSSVASAVVHEGSCQCRKCNHTNGKIMGWASYTIRSILTTLPWYPDLMAGWMCGNFCKNWLRREVRRKSACWVTWLDSLVESRTISGFVYSPFLCSTAWGIWNPDTLAVIATSAPTENLISSEYFTTLPCSSRRKEWWQWGEDVGVATMHIVKPSKPYCFGVYLEQK